MSRGYQGTYPCAVSKKVSFYQHPYCSASHRVTLRHYECHLLLHQFGEQKRDWCTTTLLSDCMNYTLTTQRMQRCDLIGVHLLKFSIHYSIR